MAKRTIRLGIWRSDGSPLPKRTPAPIAPLPSEVSASSRRWLDHQTRRQYRAQFFTLHGNRKPLPNDGGCYWH